MPRGRPAYSSQKQLGTGSGAGGPAGGDLSGFYPNPTVVGFQGRPVSAAAPAPGDAYIWNGAMWVPTAVAAALAGTTNTLAMFTSPTTIGDSAAVQTATELQAARRGRFTLTDALPAAVTTALIARHDAGGAGAAGVGVAEDFQAPNGAGTFVDVARLAATLTVVGAGVEDGVLDVILRVAGTLTALWRFETNGALRASRGANRFVYLQGYVVAATAPPPESFVFNGQLGCPATLVDPPTDGGDSVLLGGDGGVGSAAQIAGFGGNAVVLGGAPGADGGAGRFDSGYCYVDVQSAGIGNVNGGIYIGTGLGPGSGSALPSSILVGHSSTALGSIPVNLTGLVTTYVQDAVAAAPTVALTITHESTGAVAAGTGTGLLWESPTTAGGFVSGVRVDAIATNAVPGTYTTKITFLTRTAGAALAQRMQLGTGLAVGSTTDPGLGRISARGTALVVGDVALSAGWGTTAVVTSVSGDDTHGTITITAGGVGFLANPTFTLTFHDGTWGAVAPFAYTKMSGATVPFTNIAIPVTETTTATTMVGTWRGTPAAGDVFEIKFWCLGRGA